MDVRRIGLAAPFLVAVSVSLGGCATEESAPTLPPPPQSTFPTLEETSDAMNETPIRLIIGDQTLDAIVWDNPTGRDLLSRLPLTLSFKDYGRQEKIGRLDHELTMEGMPAGDDPEISDLGYYAPAGVVVLYTSDVGFWNGIARIGRINGDLSVITNYSDDFTVIIELAE